MRYYWCAVQGVWPGTRPHGCGCLNAIEVTGLVNLKELGMGDKGGKKDKQKSQKQKEKKHQSEVQKKQQKQTPNKP